MTDILFGHHPGERLVALHPLGDRSMRLYFRDPGGIRLEVEPFFPFFHLADRALLQGFRRRHWVKELSGDGYFRFLCAFEDWTSMWDAIRQVMSNAGKGSFTPPTSYADVEQLHLVTDPVTQFLVQTGRTLFKGMGFADVVRMQLDIETYTAGTHGFSDARRSGDRIILVALSDSTGWETVLDGRRGTEASLLQELTAIIRQRDPDVLEGHNILGFDLPYILTRCALHRMTFDIGRDGSPPATAEGRTPQGEGPPEIVVTDIAGRHIVDTLLLLQNFDASRHALESYGLKYAARYFGFATGDRTYVEGDRISWTWDNDPELLLRYATDDVRETRALASHLSGSGFYLSRMVPSPYGTVQRSGAAAKIELLLLRAYLRARAALPRPREGTPISGGYTDLFLTGVVGPVVLADVESLYPSIMLSRQIAPATDSLGAFLALLRELTTLRLDAKRAMQAAQGAERSRLDAVQSAFKILINSFYGYLGYARALFNDYAQADRVTIEGQAILRSMMQEIRNRGGSLIEVDTDGVYFVPPPAARTEEEERAFVAEIGRQLPPGITVACSGRYRSILSYRKKNYALLHYDGRLTVRGSSLISRSMERFGRAFVREAIALLLAGDLDGLHRLYLDTRARIEERRMDVREFARVETLRDPLAVYEHDVLGGKRNRSAAYEVARASGRAWKPGERVAYYMTGNDPGARGFAFARNADDWDPNFRDENTQYYLRRLEEFAEKFADFFPPAHFREIFSPESLFPFDSSLMHAIVREAAPEIDTREVDPDAVPGDDS